MEFINKGAIIFENNQRKIYYRDKNNTSIFYNFTSLIDFLLKNQKTIIIRWHDFGAIALEVLRDLNNRSFLHSGNKVEKKQYRTFIDKHGCVFKLMFRDTKSKIVTIIDSKKIIPVESEQLFNFIGREKTEDPGKISEYLFEIVERLENLGITQSTIGASAYNEFKKSIGFQKFDKLFPKISEKTLKQMRYAYRGAFCYLNPEYKNKVIDGVLCADENSMYSDKLNRCLLPYGAPIYFRGDPVKSTRHPLFIATIQCAYKLKRDHLPTLTRTNELNGKNKEFITNSRGAIEKLTLTNIDLDLFLEHYDVMNFEIIDGFYFRAASSIFSDYVKKWYNTKSEAKEEHDAFLYNISKLMQVALIGRFASRTRIETKIPVEENGEMILKPYSIPNKDRPYIPISIFVNAWSRYDVIKKAQKVYEQKMPDGKHAFIYSDTDSIAARTGAQLEIEVDDYKLGAWKIEQHKRARYLRPKCYIFDDDGQLTIKCSGLPAALRKNVTFENFKPGTVYRGEKVKIITQRGERIIDSTFKLE